MKSDGFELLFDADGLLSSKGLRRPGGFSWVHFRGPVLDQVQDRLDALQFPLPHAWNHEITHPNHVVLDDYGSFFHIIAYHMTFGRLESNDIPSLKFAAIHFVVHHGGVLSWCRESLPFIETLRRKMMDYPHWVTDRAGLLYAILDGLFHSLFPLLDELNDYIVQLEQHALTTTQRKSLEIRVMGLKHVVLVIRGVLASSRDMAHSLAHRFPQQPTPFYLELYDQVLRLAEIIDGYREMLDTVMDLHLSAVSNRLNEIVKTLTLVTTMMLPASLVGALYGMNFDHAPGIHWSYGFYCVLGFVALISAGLLVWFKRQAWL